LSLNAQRRQGLGSKCSFIERGNPQSSKTELSVQTITGSKWHRQKQRKPRKPGRWSKTRRMLGIPVWH